MTKPNPFWILLEGADGVGKTTLAQELLKHPEIVGDDPLLLHFPSDEMTQQLERTVPVTDLWWCAADAITGYHRQILPARNEGRTVICDRWYLSNQIYHFGYVNSSWAEHWFHQGDVRVPPDATYILDMPYEDMRERIENYEYSYEAYNELRNGYLRARGSSGLKDVSLVDARLSAHEMVLNIVKDLVSISVLPNKLYRHLLGCKENDNA